jgi:pimeloyl-ACP methyl ester carboxylesterase
MNLPETSTSFLRKLNSSMEAVKAHPVALGIIATLAAMAVANRYLAKKAERENPPVGRFVTVNGVRLHYVDQGSGTPLVFLHGNGSMIQDFQSSGLIDLAAKKYRVIAFDRPGYGHSDRPRTTIWTPEAQANLVNAALARIGVAGAIVLGHSWGTLVAVALALNHQQRIQGLILASGYYYSTVRGDTVVLSAPSIPVLGDIVRYTISPVISRLMWPLMLRKLFGPNPVPTKFNGFPKEMAVRPSQIRAGAAEAALMIPAAHSLQGEYAKLRIPVAIVAGSDDRLIDPDQSVQLHHDIARSTLKCVASNGHMIHQTATALIMSAIDLVAGKNKPREVPNVE